MDSEKPSEQQEISKSQRKRQFDNLLEQIIKLSRLPNKQFQSFALDVDFVARIYEIKQLKPNVQKREFAHLRTIVSKDAELRQQISDCFSSEQVPLLQNQQPDKQRYLFRQLLANDELLQKHIIDKNLAQQQVRQALRNYQKQPESQKYQKKLWQLLIV